MSDAALHQFKLEEKKYGNSLEIVVLEDPKWQIMQIIIEGAKRRVVSSRGSVYQANPQCQSYQCGSIRTLINRDPTRYGVRMDIQILHTYI